MEGLAPGRIVHYVAPGSADGRYPPAHRAAIVTEVPPIDPGDAPSASSGQALGARVTLMVCNPTGVHFAANVPHDHSGQQPYSWHWIERS
ncbi:MAG TPA: hypothetical protein VFQ80_00390 [Thermomicrobiales bacterium]|jgi:hypothetical protein|nr:hypothetical protein [Thermomicrobiales bacterium]